MEFSDLVKETENTWKKLVEHPFVVEIYQGVLPKEKFDFYLKQDYYYLDQSMRNMGLLVAKAENIEIRKKFIKILYSEEEVEFSGYEKLLNKRNISPKEVENINPTRANVSYTNYLLSISSQKTFTEGIAALLPCYWSYLKIGEFHQDKLYQNDNQLYQNWASVYTNEDYIGLVDDIVEIFERNINKYNHEKLKEFFTKSLKFEYEFFSDVYKMEKWKY